jgi:hypothetical protein
VPLATDSRMRIVPRLPWRAFQGKSSLICLGTRLRPYRPRRTTAWPLCVRSMRDVGRLLSLRLAVQQVRTVSLVGDAPVAAYRPKLAEPNAAFLQVALDPGHALARPMLGQPRRVIPVVRRSGPWHAWQEGNIGLVRPRERSEERKRRDREGPLPTRYDLPPERIASAELRRLPGFVIIGTQKGGTSSLYHYLTSHPDSAPAFTKEVHFFNRWHHKGIDWYRAFFPLEAEAAITGEASPNYLVHPPSAGRLGAALPQAKVIIMLRNPVDRAYSQYRMQRRRGSERRSFELAIADEPPRQLDDDGDLDLAWARAAYRGRGLYADQIEPWLEAIVPARLLVLRSEDFFADPSSVYRETTDFLGMRPWLPDRFCVLQEGGDHEPLMPEIAIRLAEWYEPHNRRLYDLIGRDMGWGRW